MYLRRKLRKHLDFTLNYELIASVVELFLLRGNFGLPVWNRSVKLYCLDSRHTRLIELRHAGS